MNAFCSAAPKGLGGAGLTRLHLPRRTQAPPTPPSQVPAPPLGTIDRSAPSDHLL
jgi:hypothetical protein